MNVFMLIRWDHEIFLNSLYVYLRLLLSVLHENRWRKGLSVLRLIFLSVILLYFGAGNIWTISQKLYNKYIFVWGRRTFDGSSISVYFEMFYMYTQFLFHPHKQIDIFLHKMCLLMAVEVFCFCTSTFFIVYWLSIASFILGHSIGKRSTKMVLTQIKTSRSRLLYVTKFRLGCSSRRVG